MKIYLLRNGTPCMEVASDATDAEKRRYIAAEFDGEYAEGDVICLELDSPGFAAVRFDESLAESIVYLPQGRFEYRIPFGRERKDGYAPGAFAGLTHSLTARALTPDEAAEPRLISLNSHDLRRAAGCYPHAYASAVTRDEPCFYERNAIDGHHDNSSHGGYPYHSWAAGAREDIEYTLDFGADVAVDRVTFYLRADFPHDTYWRSVDISFSDSDKVTARLERTADPQTVDCGGKITDKIKLCGFVQGASPLSWAALSQLEVYGHYIVKEKEMEIRYPSSPADFRTYDTKRIREEYHIRSLFTQDNRRIVYSHFDRLIIAGLMPVYHSLTLDGGAELASEYFLERRELGCINIGGPGVVTADGQKYPLETGDGLYVGCGVRELLFESVDTSNPAKFYVTSSPAHASYPTVLIPEKSARHVPLGTVEDCNKRVITQYLHPSVLKTCQLSMGLTRLSPGSNWNTMPCHTHERRMEAYLYLELGPDDVVFHMMGTPTETRHIVVRNEEAVISPSWSIHSGVGTRAYAFIWAMCGENQDFDDMDAVETRSLL